MTGSSASLPLNHDALEEDPFLFGGWSLFGGGTVKLQGVYPFRGIIYNRIYIDTYIYIYDYMIYICIYARLFSKTCCFKHK